MCRSRLRPFDWGKYRGWLFELIMVPERMDYFLVLNTLVEKSFYWDGHFNDDNRAADGFELREEFADDTYYLDAERPCSMLEVMIGLARRMDAILSDAGDEQVSRWFWEMFDNLGLGNFPDDNYDADAVSDLIEGWLDRRYNRNGKPGLYPLKHAEVDQRKVEIWAQMSAYINENYGVI